MLALCWCIGGFVNGIAGFGAALIAMPIICLSVPLSLAVPSCTIIGVLLCVQMAWTYRHDIDFDRLKPVYIGTVPGAIAGITLMKELPASELKLVMGVFLFMYACWGFFWEGTQQKVVHKNWGAVAGFFSSAISASVGMGGPPTIVYTSLAGWSKNAIKAGIASYFIVSGVIIISMQVYAGIQTANTVMLAAVGGFAVLIGARGGVVASRRIGGFVYRKMLFGLLALMACLILFNALK